MTTVPSRLPFLGAVLDRVLAQTFRRFTLRMYIPAVCSRTGERYQLPEYLTDYERRVQVCHIDDDYGPATKLLGPLADTQAPRHERIITIDDDVLLEPHAIEELVAAAGRCPNEAIGFMGVSSGHFIHAENLSARRITDAAVSVLGGYRAILYPLEILDDSITDDYDAVADRGPPFVDDDHLFSWNLARRGIRRRVIATRYPGRHHGLNIELLDLPDSITFGADGGAAVERSHRLLIEYYRNNGWEIPI